jgi:hypothetical protein
LELLTASYYLLGQVLKQVSALSRQVALIEAQIKRGGGGDNRGSSSSESQKKKKKTEKGKAAAVEDSESELSKLEDKEGGGDEGGD